MHIPENIVIPPMKPKKPIVSPNIKYEKMAPKTGSAEKIIAIFVGLEYF
jgi:hypothetical protein